MLLAIAATSLLACSTVRLAYNNLPELSYWWLDGYLDFNGAQTPRVRDDLAALLAWHRRDELPKLAAVLAEAQRLAPDDVTPEQACALVADVRERVLAVVRQAEPAAAALAVSLEPAQRQKLEAKYAKVNATYRKEWLDLSRQAVSAKRFDLYLERSEDFYGSLDTAQRDLMREQVARSSFDPQKVDANRRQRQQETIAMLARLQADGASPTQAQVALHDWALRFVSPPPGGWRDYQKAALDEGCRNASALHNSTTPAQRERAARRLRAYEDDARQLAGAGG